MKIKLNSACLPIIACVVMIMAGINPAGAQGTAFTYQGRLNDGGSVANGSYHLTFAIFDRDIAGNQVGSTFTNAAVGVSNGLFVAALDFGGGIFDGTARWLQIGVSTNGSGSFATLSPRQEITATPYAVYAGSAASAASVAAGSVASAQFSTPTAPVDGQVLAYTGGSLLWTDPIAGGSIWSLNGANAYYNAGNVGIGTNNPQSKLSVKTATGLYGVTHTDGITSLGSYIGGSGSGASGGWLGTLSAHPLHLFVGGGQPSLTIDTAGDVGIGTFTPSAGILLEVNGPTRMTPGGSGGEVRFHTPSGESGMSIFGVNRADIRFDGSSLKLVAGPGTGAPGSLNGLVINTNGNVGIGTTTPFAKLSVNSSADGIYAVCTGTGAIGVFGQSVGTSGVGIYGLAASSNGEGVHGKSTGSGAAVNGTSEGSGTGVYGTSASGYAGYFAGPVLTTGRISANAGMTASGSPAGSFLGNVSISGNLTVGGSVTKAGGTFKIDHPLDPANKYLSHSFVESPDMMNIYNGNAAMDAQGEAVVRLPEWFGSLNKDFRYQLTALGAPGSGLYIAEEIAGNQFRIAGGKPGGRVSWQVTGVRQDAFANAHRTPVEEEKIGSERGTYLHPELFGPPAEKSLVKKEH